MDVSPDVEECLDRLFRTANPGGNQCSALSNRLVGEFGRLDINPTFINLRRWGLENLNGSHTEIGSEALRRWLLPKDTTSLHHADGVHFAGITYAGGFLEKTHLREYARARRAKKMECRHDPSYPDTLYALNPESRLTINQSLQHALIEMPAMPPRSRVREPPPLGSTPHERGSEGIEFDPVIDGFTGRRITAEFLA